MIVLLLNYLRRSWLIGIADAVAAFVFSVVGCRVFAQVSESAGAAVGSAFAQFMPKWAQAAFNVGPESMTQLNGFISVCLQHPFMLTVLLALPITLLTGWLSGDVENRSMAMILCRPVSRIQIVTAIVLVASFWSAVAVGAAWAGFLIGAHWAGLTATLATGRLAIAVLHLASLVLAFSGIAAAISSAISVRGDAVGWSLTVVLVMYVWNFLAQVWYGGGGAHNYSLFRYYKPTQILLQNAGQSSDALILALIGIAGFIIAALLFRFRSFSV